MVKLILVIPATNAVSERSFSSLKRIKTYLRSTIANNRLKRSHNFAYSLAVNRHNGS